MNYTEEQNALNDEVEGELLRRMRKLQVQQAVTAVLGTLVFFCVTLLLLADVITDVWVLVLYGLQSHQVFLGAGVFFLFLASLHIGLVYAAQTQRACKEPSKARLVCCFLLNVPFQLGVVCHRAGLVERRCALHAHTDSRLHWLFVKLKLIQAMFQSLPQLLLNSLHVLVYADQSPAAVQYVSAAVSFLSVIVGMTLYEQERKAQLQLSASAGMLQVLFIFIYKLFIVGSRIIAAINFIYFYGVLSLLLFVPHFVIVLAVFTLVYRKVWKVRLQKIFLTSLYCIFGYFPVHNHYRPEGEIMIYYSLFMMENVIMVALPYSYPPTRPVASWHLPHTEYYKVMTLTTLLGSAAGLIFMAVYYFLLHRSSVSIREAHFGCLPAACLECSCLSGAPNLSDGNLSILDNATPSQDSVCAPHEAALHPPLGDAGPPRYTSRQASIRPLPATDPGNDVTANRTSTPLEQSRERGYLTDEETPVKLGAAATTL